MPNSCSNKNSEEILEAAGSRAASCALHHRPGLEGLVRGVGLFGPLHEPFRQPRLAQLRHALESAQAVQASRERTRLVRPAGAGFTGVGPGLLHCPNTKAGMCVKQQRAHQLGQRHMMPGTIGTLMSYFRHSLTKSRKTSRRNRNFLLNRDSGARLYRVVTKASGVKPLCYMPCEKQLCTSLHQVYCACASKNI